MCACSYDITTDRGKVRRLVNDTSTISCTLSDAEIDAFLSMASNDVLMAASYAAESLAATVMDGMTAEKIGDYSYSKKSVDNWIALAKKYKEESASTPAMTWAEPDLAAFE